MNNNLFNLWAPLDLIDEDEVEKAGDKAKVGTIRGIASTEAQDADGEIVDQEGLDWDYFKSNGFLTYEHPMMVANIVGEPRNVVHTDVDGVRATAVEGILYLTDPMGKQVWGKACAMQKAGGKRRLGFSIEGSVIERDGSRITKAKVTSVAISPRPKNDLTWWEPLMRSYMARSFSQAGHASPQGGSNFMGDFGPLTPQSIQGGKADTSSFQVDVGKLLSGLTVEDMGVARILKRLPQLSWSQGIEVLSALKRTTKDSGRNKT